MRTRENVVEDLLVLAAQAGSISAFERLATRWHPRLLRQARRLTRDADGAGDVVQDAWVDIVRGLMRLRDPSSFGPWALRIIGRRSADWIARRRTVRGRTSGEECPAEIAAPRDWHSEHVARARDAIRHLAPEDRLLMTMCHVEGLTVGELAKTFGVPPGTIKSRLFHARERLRAALEVSDVAHNRR